MIRAVCACGGEISPRSRFREGRSGQELSSWASWMAPGRIKAPSWLNIGPVKHCVGLAVAARWFCRDHENPAIGPVTKPCTPKRQSETLALA